MDNKINKLAVFVSAALISVNVQAASLVNNSGATLQISNGLLVPGTGVNLANGASFNIPVGWGDSQHKYLNIHTAGMALCGNKYGVAKLSAGDNHQVTENYVCELFVGDLPVDEPIDEPVDEPVDDPVDDPVDTPIDEPVDDGGVVWWTIHVSISPSTYLTHYSLSNCPIIFPLNP